jgi:glycosyltransferase involved in cell wall biosynthesis
VHVVPNGFDAAAWEARASPRPASDGSVLMLGVGHGRRAARKKGLDVLLTAWRGSLARGRRLVLVGQPAFPLPAGVHVERDADEAQLRTLMATAAVLVYPSRSEGFGYPPLEAMAAGTPVLTTDGGAIPEVVGDAACIVPAGDADALHEALAALLASADRRETLVAAGRERARGFPPERSSARIEAVLRAAREAS